MGNMESIVLLSMVMTVLANIFDFSIFFHSVYSSDTVHTLKLHLDAGVTVVWLTDKTDGSDIFTQEERKMMQ